MYIYANHRLQFCVKIYHLGNSMDEMTPLPEWTISDKLYKKKHYRISEA